MNLGILGGGIDTGVFQRRCLVHELVFACSPPPPPRLQISHTILTQADCCAVRARAGTRPSHHDHGGGTPSVLALIEACGLRRFRGKTSVRARWSLGPQSHCAVRQRTGSRFSRGTDLPKRGIQRGRQTVPTEILATGDYLRAQPSRRGLSGQVCR